MATTSIRTLIFEFQSDISMQKLTEFRMDRGKGNNRDQKILKLPKTICIIQFKGEPLGKWKQSLRFFKKWSTGRKSFHYLEPLFFVMADDRLVDNSCK